MEKTTTNNDTNFPTDILSPHRDTFKRSSDHRIMQEKQDVSIRVLKILGQHWLIDTGFLLAFLSLPGPGFIFRRWLIDCRPLCTSLNGTVPPRGSCVGQTKALQKVEAMMGINGWEMSANSAVYHAGEHFVDIHCSMWTDVQTPFIGFIPEINLWQQRLNTPVTFSNYVDMSCCFIIHIYNNFSVLFSYMRGYFAESLCLCCFNLLSNKFWTVITDSICRLMENKDIVLRLNKLYRLIWG